MLATRLGLRAAFQTVYRTCPRTTLRSRSSLFSTATRRTATYQRFPGKEGRTHTYSNFGPVYRAQYIWYNYRPAVLVVGAGGGAIYVFNLETVPVTGRRRFNIISPENEKQIGGAGAYEQVLQEFQGKILPESHPHTLLVARVVQRLLPTAHGLAGEEWKVHVVDDPQQKNAFVIPGGKVFVFTGLLPICQDESGLAVVLGHEIAHNVAHHAAERMSRAAPLTLLAFASAMVLDVSGQLAQTLISLVLELPNSRTQEAEADRIGLSMTAEACYDPEAAIGLWQRMAEAEKGAPPQFLSTHPTSYHRIDSIKGWLPEARAKYDEAGCGGIKGYKQDFQQAFKGQGLRTRREPIAVQQGGGDEDDFF